jgi:thioredoxin 1
MKGFVKITKNKCFYPHLLILTIISPKHLFFIFIPITFVSQILLVAINKKETILNSDHMALEHLTKDTFKEKVFDYEKNNEWKFEGKVPAIVDFYADWCGPCKMVAPILEELQNEYGDKLTIFKVNTDEQQELSAVFGIQSIPSILFIPLDGKPQMAAGALPKNSFKSAINDVLNVSIN